MGLTKAQNVFDSAVPANGDAVAAYLFASNRLTSAAVNGNESLRTIAALQDGAGTALTSTLLSGKQSLDVNVAGFSATDLHVDGTVADDAVDANNPIKIGSKAFSGLLAAISTAGDRADALSDMYRRIYVSDAPQVGNLVTHTTVGLTAVKIVATPMAGRTRLLVQNNSDKPMYIGFDNSVTADATVTGGLVLPAHGGTLDIPSGDGLEWWAICGTAGKDLLVVEYG